MTDIAPSFSETLLLLVKGVGLQRENEAIEALPEPQKRVAASIQSALIQRIERERREAAVQARAQTITEVTAWRRRRP